MTTAPAVGRDGVIRVGAYVLCLDDSRRVILCRIAEPLAARGRSTLPGGGLDFGEPPESGALREFAEETGLTAELDGVVGTHSFHRVRSESFAGRPLHWIGIIFRGRVTGGSLRDETDGSTDQCRWFTEAEARALPLVDLADRGIGLAFGDRA